MPDQVDWRALEREASPGRAVGRLLRDQREARGLTLNDVENKLRIRLAHLQAIEEGRFDLLPGAAYVPAFLRAYALHVGLDAEKVLSAYHLSGAVPIKRPLAMPADFPVVERRAPIGLAVLTVLLVIAAGYAAWHYLPREQTVVAEKVPPVPDRLLASRPAATEATPAPQASAPQASAPQASAPQASAPQANTGTPATTSAANPAGNSELANRGVGDTKRPSASAPQSVAPNVWPGRRESVAPPTQSQTQEVPLAPPVVVAVPAPPPPPAVVNVPAIGQAQAAQPPAQPEPARPAPQAAAPVEEATARNPPAETPPPVAPAIAPVKVDTPVRMRGNSWVELRAPNGDILAQTYVRAGESYVIPAGIAYRVIDAR
ncbi:MAG: helix-turn-helix domain-containing protein [Alphaproteobacteria bacterium]|nr:helix-turn-helix domain-containing protein [Alphaproteobacteria bacterium]